MHSSTNTGKMHSSTITGEGAQLYHGSGEGAQLYQQWGRCTAPPPRGKVHSSTSSGVAAQLYYQWGRCTALPPMGRCRAVQALERCTAQPPMGSCTAPPRQWGRCGTRLLRPAESHLLLLRQPPPQHPVWYLFFIVQSDICTIAKVPWLHL